MADGWPAVSFSTTVPSISNRSDATPHWAFREIAPSAWDGLLWGSGIVALVGIVFSSLVPAASELAVLFSLTLFANGPYGALLPTVQEPVVMVFARLYPPIVVATVVTASVTAVEYVNYRLFDAAVHSNLFARARETKQMERVVHWFEKQPFLTVVVCALTPIPFVLGRIVAVAARYPVSRFLTANAVGRFPRFWMYGAIGAWLPFSSLSILVAGGVLTIALVAWMLINRANKRLQDLRLNNQDSGFFGFRNNSRSPMPREVIPRPLNHDQQALLELNQEHQVHEKPQQPRRIT